MSDLGTRACLALTLCWGFAAAARGDTPAAAPPTWDEYKILVERNMFLRNRTRPVQRVYGSPQPTYPPEHFLVLKGIVRQGNAYTAFFEDTRARATSTAVVGGQMAQGRIVRIALDHVEYEKDGRITKVEMGKTLEGTVSTGASTPAPPAPPAATGSASSETKPAAPAAGSEDERAILERLRQRREAELNGK